MAHFDTFSAVLILLTALAGLVLLIFAVAVIRGSTTQSRRNTNEIPTHRSLVQISITDQIRMYEAWQRANAAPAEFEVLN